VRRGATPLALALFLVAAAAGCGGDDAAPTQFEPASVYFLLDEQVWPSERDLAGDDLAGSVVTELVEGPTTEEAEMGLTGGFPEGVQVSVTGDVASVEFDGELTTEQLAQLVYSLTQPVLGVASVDVGGTTYTRADFEKQTPAVLVESPLPFEEVPTPITATGTANTFEATFHYELVDAAGSVLAEDFVTATSGSGTRGTFEFTTADVEDVFALVVFETSAEDGSRIREVRIPLTQGS
jgi:hypothetical protein